MLECKICQSQFTNPYAHMVAESIEPTFTIEVYRAQYEFNGFHIDAMRIPTTNICIMGAQGYVLSFSNTSTPSEHFEKFSRLYKRLQILVIRCNQGLM